MTEKSEVSETIDAVARLTESVPIYQDLVQPTAQELGKNIHTISKIVTVALAPVRGLVWGYEQIESYLCESLTQRLENTPQEDIEPPPIKVAGPVLEAMRFCSDEEELKEMFANLLANSMDKSTKSKAHPAYVEVLKNLNGDEAKILNHIARIVDPRNNFSFPVIDQIAFYPNRKGNAVIHPLTASIAEDAGCENPELVVNYINNLVRMGVFSISEQALVKPGVYEPIEALDLYKQNQADIESMQQYLDEPIVYQQVKKNISLTNFGRDLINIAVRNKN